MVGNFYRQPCIKRKERITEIQLILRLTRIPPGESNEI